MKTHAYDVKLSLLCLAISCSVQNSNENKTVPRIKIASGGTASTTCGYTPSTRREEKFNVHKISSVTSKPRSCNMVMAHFIVYKAVPIFISSEFYKTANMNSCSRKKSDQLINSSHVLLIYRLHLSRIEHLKI